MKKILITAVLTFAFTAFAIQAIESSIFSAEGIIESTSGGFMFPDGSVQTSAAYPASSQCTAITTIPTTIVTEGVYCFTGNLNTSITTGNAITIDADDVTINMNGWKLDGLGGGIATSAYGIRSDQHHNITIRNGTIQGFLFAIELGEFAPWTTYGHLIEDIRAVKNTYVGIAVYGVGNIVRRNQVIDTGGLTVERSREAYGIQLVGEASRALNNDIIQVTAVGTDEGVGLYLGGGRGSVAEGNRIENVSSGTGATYGIAVVGSFELLAVDNRITNVATGINYAFASSSGKYRDNLTSNVSVPFAGGTDAGGND